ncbi:reverse transcriptase domain-containing protein [Tanacetum coccineum]
MKFEESLNVTFDEITPPTKLSPLVDDDVDEEEAIRKNTKVLNTNNEEDELIEVEEIVNIKDSKNHPLDQIVGLENFQTTPRRRCQRKSTSLRTMKPNPWIALEYRRSIRSYRGRSQFLAIESDSNVHDLIPFCETQFGGVTDWYLEQGIPLMNAGELPEMDPYEEVSKQRQAAPLSPAYVSDPMELEHHILVYISEPVYLEYHVPSDDDIQIKDQPYVTDASPSALSPGYIAASNLKEDPEEDSEEDSIDYAADTDDDEEESSNDDEEEEEHLALLLILLYQMLIMSPPLRRQSCLRLMSLRLHHHHHHPHTIPSPPTHHPLSLPAPSTSHRADIPEAELLPQKGLLLTAPITRFKIRESSSAAAARQPRSTASVYRRESEEFQTRHQDAQDDRAALRDEVDTLRRYLSSLCTTHKKERVEARQALDRSKAHIRALEARIVVLETQAYRHKWQRQDTDDRATRHIMRIQALEAGTRVDTLEDTGSGRDLTRLHSRGVYYKDFLNCHPLTSEERTGVFGWDPMDGKDGIVGLDVAYAMPWKTLSNMMTTKYWPRSEIKKLEHKIWNLKVKGTELASYTQHFQELALLCRGMFHAKLDEVEKYVGGLPDMIQGNVMSARPKTMQEAIKLANDLMDQKVYTYAERQTENKRKQEDNSRSNHNQQQPFKKQNVARAYTTGSSDKKEYGGYLTKCTKCNYHHKGPCAPRCHSCNKVGHLAHDCRNHARANAANGNQVGNGNDVAKAYAMGTARTNPNNNVVTEIGSFDVIIGMDWLSKYQAVIVCSEKIVRVSFGNEILIVRESGGGEGWDGSGGGDDRYRYAEKIRREQGEGGKGVDYGLEDADSDVKVQGTDRG